MENTTGFDNEPIPGRGIRDILAASLWFIDGQVSAMLGIEDRSVTTELIKIHYGMLSEKQKAVNAITRKDSIPGLNVDELQNLLDKLSPSIRDRYLTDDRFALTLPDTSMIYLVRRGLIGLINRYPEDRSALYFRYVYKGKGEIEVDGFRRVIEKEGYIKELSHVASPPRPSLIVKEDDGVTKTKASYSFHNGRFLLARGNRTIHVDSGNEESSGYIGKSARYGDLFTPKPRILFQGHFPEAHFKNGNLVIPELGKQFPDELKPEAIFPGVGE
jgi:hypothetical protein